MSQFNDGMFRDSNLRIRNVTQAQFNAQKVNFNPDVIYRVDGVLHLPDENTETYASAVTATRDEFGNVVGLSAAGGAYPQRLTFAELSAAYPPTASLAGMHAWCTDYPSVGGFGAEVVCTGSRWKSISQQHCLLSPPSVVAGTLFAAGSAAALYGSTVLVPGGVLEPDDNIRFIAIAQHPTIGTGSRSIGLYNAASSEGVIAGSAVSRFAHAVSSANQITVEKVSTLLSNTVARSTTSGQPVSAIAGSAAQLSETITSIASNHHIGIVVTPSADTSWLLYAASVYVEFAR